MLSEFQIHAFRVSAGPCKALETRRVASVDPCALIFSQRALQRVVVVLEVLELQKVLGPLAALARRQVSHLDGGRASQAGRAGQVLGCRLVLLIQTG